MERHVYELKEVRIRAQCVKCERAIVLSPGDDLPDRCPNRTCLVEWDTRRQMEYLPAPGFLYAVRSVIEDKEPPVRFSVEGDGP